MAETSLIPKKVPAGIEYYKAEGLGAFSRLALIFLILAGVFSGLLYLYKKILIRQIDQQRAVLADLDTKFEPSLINELERLSNSINNAKALINSHTYISPIFDFLEKNTLPDVSFSTFNYNADKKTLSLAGEAPSYTEIASQIKIIQNQPEILSATFSNTSLKETGSVNFTTVINFK
ncbi:MAG: hypothetical protein UW30_C0015G0030 [Candidatus Giovannonibacteria bacterium GW2011_GWA2_44_13b]|uniref:Fimbrial assembly family protein n=2 Tax=Candidatus Giovannoniibacteriota TaxID=1752738 RepID=A0A0G1JZP3_9BACT|nr:MAG: hypothetical protein UW30_C0015G0030 [Candidatus Giovannonibacteria bacterium GW2011_GWA2_44_13b]OGF82467.1 MAG: hypothetical protein A2924_01265 [Candidatus Giovannonibacteria bacterium RIFCSPLOWO2_01_FULL_44_16]